MRKKSGDVVLVMGSTLLIVANGILATYLGLLLPRSEESYPEIAAVLFASAVAWLAAALLLGRVFRCGWRSFAPLLLVSAGFLAVGVAATKGLGAMLLLSLGLLVVLGLLAAVWTDSMVKRGQRTKEAGAQPGA